MKGEWSKMFAKSSEPFHLSCNCCIIFLETSLHLNKIHIRWLKVQMKCFSLTEVKPKIVAGRQSLYLLFKLKCLVTDKKIVKPSGCKLRSNRIENNAIIKNLIYLDSFLTK